MNNLDKPLENVSNLNDAFSPALASVEAKYGCGNDEDRVENSYPVNDEFTDAKNLGSNCEDRR